MKYLIAFLSVFAALAASAETPREAAAAIHALLEAEDYPELFQTRYAEWHKVESAGVDPATAIERMAERWKKQRAVILPLFQQLTEAEFEIMEHTLPQAGETGRKAIATVELDGKPIPYTLYEMANGLWGFHM